MDRTRDRTHWFGCWEQHHACALTRIEQLEKAMVKIKEAALNAMNNTKDLTAQLEINQIIFEIEKMNEKS